MTAILFTIAAVLLVWLVIVSPGVIRKHRVWRALAEFDRAIRAATAAVDSARLATEKAMNSFKAFTKAMSTPEVEQ